MPQLDRQLEMLIQHLPKVWDSPIEKIRGDVTTNHVEWLWIIEKALPIWMDSEWHNKILLGLHPACLVWRFLTTGCSRQQLKILWSCKGAFSKSGKNCTRSVKEGSCITKPSKGEKVWSLAWNVKLLTSAAYWCSSKQAKNNQKITRRCINVLSFSNTPRGFSSPGLMLTTLSARLIW